MPFDISSLSLRGRLTPNAPLAPLTWFRTGGAAEWLFRPADAADLADFLKVLPDGVPITLLGAGSNILVRDGGISGVVIKLGRGFNEITLEGDSYRVGAAVLDATLAQTAAAEGRAGLEFLIGVPGSIGGAVRMNAGCYGAEVADVLESVAVVDRRGQAHTVQAAELGLSYRHSAFPDDWMIIGAVLRAPLGEAEAIADKMAHIRTMREEAQPLGTRTGGSTFANPPGDRAWRLIDAAGCRGLRQGGAMVSEKHCNFLINTGTATSADIEDLAHEVCRRVLAHSGVELRWEIRCVGEKA
jgi:UDP-N-acetylmuramate dehydrogenase